MQETGNERLTEYAQYDHTQHTQRHHQDHLQAEYIAYTVIVPLSKELCTKDARTGYCAKYAQIKNRDQLVCNSHACQLLCTQLTYCDIVGQTDHIGNAVLYHDRYCYAQYRFIELLIADEFHSPS